MPPWMFYDFFKIFIWSLAVAMTSIIHLVIFFSLSNARTFILTAISSKFNSSYIFSKVYPCKPSKVIDPSEVIRSSINSFLEGKPRSSFLQSFGNFFLFLFYFYKFISLILMSSLVPAKIKTCFE